HTRSKRDWSSDVCSSDLRGILPSRRLLIIYSLLSVTLLLLSLADLSWVFLISVNVFFVLASFFDLLFVPKRHDIQVGRRVEAEKIGRASCRERVEYWDVE